LPTYSGLLKAYDFLEKINQILMPTQFGLRENYSTTLAITQLYDQIKERDKNNVAVAFFGHSQDL